MGLIKEPLDVDFYVLSKTLTQKGREAISQHILEYKEKTAKQKSRRLSIIKKAVIKSKKKPEQLTFSSKYNYLIITVPN